MNLEITNMRFNELNSVEHSLFIDIPYSNTE